MHNSVRYVKVFVIFNIAWKPINISDQPSFIHTVQSVFNDSLISMSPYSPDTASSDQLVLLHWHPCLLEAAGQPWYCYRYLWDLSFTNFDNVS